MPKTSSAAARTDALTTDAFRGTLPQGLFETALAYRAASWRFEAHRRTHGLDACAGPLLDEVTQARRLMFAVLDTLVIDMIQAAREHRPQDGARENPRSTAQRPPQ